MTPAEKARLDRITEPGILLWRKDSEFVNALVARLERRAERMESALLGECYCDRVRGCKFCLPAREVEA